MINHHRRRTVVVGVDGSEEALRAVRWGAAEAARRGIPLRLMHAFAWTSDRAGGRSALSDRYRTVLLDRARTFVAAAAAVARTAAPGIDVEEQVVVGSPFEVLGDESHRARLMVLGDRGLTRFEGLLAGSVAVALAARGDCPVVVVRGPERDEPGASARPIVVGVCGRPTSEAALAFAYEAASMRRAPLVAVHAWSDVMPDPLVVLPPDRATLETEAQEVLAERLAGWGEKYPDVDVERVVVADRPAHALMREAADAQLVVVGSRGHRELAGLVLGSVGNVLIHRAACPVAVVRVDA